MTMTAQEALKLISKILQTRHLTQLEMLVIQGIWQELSYSEMVVKSGYETGYIKNVSYQLRQSLSDVLKQKVSKTNLRAVLQRYSLKPQPVENIFTTTQIACDRQDGTEALDVSVSWEFTAEPAKLKQSIVKDLCRLAKLLHGNTEPVLLVALGCDGKILVSSSQDETIELWDINTGECLKTLKTQRLDEEIEDLTGVTGLTPAQIATLKTLNAFDEK